MSHVTRINESGHALTYFESCHTNKCVRSRSHSMDGIHTRMLSLTCVCETWLILSDATSRHVCEGVSCHAWMAFVFLMDGIHMRDLTFAWIAFLYFGQHSYAWHESLTWIAFTYLIKLIVLLVLFTWFALSLLKVISCSKLTNDALRLLILFDQITKLLDALTFFVF